MKRLLQDMRIMPKILAMLLMLGAVTVGIAVMNAFSMKAEDQEYSQMVSRELPATTQLVRMNRFVTEMVQIGYRTTAFAPASIQAQSAPAEIEKSHENALKALNTAVELDPTLTKTAFDNKGRIDTIHRLATQGSRLVLAGQRDAGVRQLNEAEGQLDSFSRNAVELNVGRIKKAEERSVELGQDTETTIVVSLALAILATLIGVVSAYWVVRRGITAPITALEARMRRLADGDSASEIAGTDRKDEIGAMAQALQVFRDAAVKQDKMIRAVTESANAIRRGSTEIAQASEDLAKRTESNAASLEETSAAMTEMSQRLKDTAESSDRTVARADQTMTTVQGGRGVADEAVQAMGRVSESAKGIDSVIEGLDKIAFQTRVLAMNAAVEAGRAGEAGRGFAVVADLVSALAMRAEEEAKRARGQLTVTQADITTAVEAVERVDGALQNISGDVGEVHDLLRVMAADNQAQARAITEINAAVASMDQATQQNAAMVEQTSAAARSLLTEVQSLTVHASEFKVDRRKEQMPRHLWPVDNASGGGSPVRAAPARVEAAPPAPVVHQLQRKAVAAAGGGRAHDDWTEF